MMMITDIYCPGCEENVYAIRRDGKIVTICGDRSRNPCEAHSAEHHMTARLIGALQFMQYDRDTERATNPTHRE